MAARDGVGRRVAAQTVAVSFVPRPTWQCQKENDLVARLPPRENALMVHSRIFGGDALTNVALDEESLRPYVEFVFDELSGKSWPLKEEDFEIIARRPSRGIA